MALRRWSVPRVRSRIWHKLAAIVLAGALPLMIATYLLAAENGQRIDLTQNELRGLDYLGPLSSLLNDISAHRTLSRQPVTDGPALAPRRTLDARINADFALLLDAERQVGGHLATDAAARDTDTNPAHLFQKWRTWQSAPPGPAASDAIHDSMIVGLRSLITNVGATANLVRDPETKTYDVADALLVQVPDLLDRIRRLADDIDDKAATGGPLSATDRIETRATVPVLKLRIDAVRDDLVEVFRNVAPARDGDIQGSLAPLESSANLTITSLIDLTGRVLLPTAGPILDRTGFRRAADQAGAAVVELWNGLLSQERRMLQVRRAADGRERTVGAAAILAAIVVTVLLAGWLSRRITTGVGTVAGAASQLAGGDLTQRVRVRARDEIGAMATAFNTMAERLAEMVEQREESRRTIRAERDFVHAVVDVAGSLVLVLDRAGRVVRFNRACELTTGYSFAEVEGRPFGEVFPSSADGVGTSSAVVTFDDVPGGDFPASFEQALVARDGGRRYIAWSTASLPDDEGEIGHLVATGLDITARRAAEVALREAQERFRQAFDNAPIGICLVGMDTRYLQVNRALCEMLGYSETELLQRSFADVTHPDEVSANLIMVGDLVAGRVQHQHTEKRYIRSDGQPVWAQVAISVVPDEAGGPSYFIVQIQDITQRRAAEALLAHRAMHDSLTGLPNRALLMDRLALELERSGRELTMTAVLFVDLDGFKMINDGLGHDLGDQVLVEVSRRLTYCVRAADTVARLGGDEFVILCPDVESEENVRAITGRLASTLAIPIVLAQMEAAVTASIGVAMCVGAQQSAEDLVRDADAAMLSAKAHGKNGFDVFDRSLRERADDRVVVESMLRRALRDDRFRLYFQPILDLRTDQMIGVESLIRLDDPERGLLAPGSFIGVAEEVGLIVPIGGWVLRHACRELAEWRRTGAVAPSLHTAVNLSVRQVTRADLGDTVRRALAEAELEPQALVLEFTESMLMDLDKAMLGQLEDLRDMGVRLGIDDFGTGYSSLTYLKRLPVSFIKIDRSFVSGLATDSSDREIVTAVIRLGQALGLTTIAEGVEDADQWAALKELGCDQAQGYLFGRPLPGPPRLATG